MDNRVYFEVKIPHQFLMHTLEVCVGEDGTKKYSLDKEWIIAKTTQERIDRKIGRGVSYNKIFPPELSTQLTYEEAYTLAQTPKYREEGI